MEKPLIGVVASRWSSSLTQPNTRVQGQLNSYLDAIQGAGGLPVFIPLLPADDLRAVYARVDGVIIPGGGDIDPALYRAPRHPSTDEIDAERDRVELSLARFALDDGKPIFGICRGIQILNVALGGTLYQDLPSEHAGALNHYYHYPQHPLDHLAHNVQVEEDSLLAQCVGSPIVEVNSRHHQAPRDLAPGLQIVARAPDGVIEAVEVPSHPFALGVQWHPENLQAHTGMKALFERFVEEAGKRGNSVD